MKVTEKYKQTEVGLIPSDWELVELGSISNISSGGTPNRGIAAYWNGGIPWVTTSQIDFNTINQSFEFITEEGLNNSAAKIYKKGTLLMAMYGQGKTRGKVAILGIDATTNQACAAIYVNKDILKEYVFCNLSGRYDEIRNLSNTGNQENLSGELIKKILIPLPPTKAEQSAIATALSDADALINSLEKLIAKKRNIKQGAMQQLLQPKEGWLNKSLGEIGEITGAGVDKLIVEGETPVRLVNYMDVFNRDFIYSKELNHWVTAPSHKANKCSVKQGDIFFTPSSEMRYDIAVSAVAMEDIPDAVYSYHLVRLRLFEDWDLNFRTYIFKTKYFLGQAEQICEGSGKRYVITLPKFRSMKIFYPPTKEEQTRIATILSDMDAEIATLEAKLEKYRKVKLGMMQNLLTGKIRLNQDLQDSGIDRIKNEVV
ncbi:MAG: restriction endonuclease subunit S [Bacteroidetes bacterium]|nr:restriction endonuclease subunit S [Bacteroidota bacterium]